MLDECGVSERHGSVAASLDKLKGKDCWTPQERSAYAKAVGAVRKQLTAGRHAFAIIGQLGRGKTQIASTAVLQAIRQHGRPAKIITALKLLGDLKARYSDRRGAAELDWLRAWSCPWLLVIDEFQERLGAENEQVHLTAMVDERYQRCLPTVLMGNITLDQFAAVVGSSIADRCNEGGGIVVCEGWPSFRSTADQA